MIQKIVILHFLVLLFFIFVSCKEKKNSRPSSNWYTLADLVDDNSNSHLHNSLIFGIEKSIAEYPSVDGNGVGIGNGISKQFENYCSLKKLCTTDQLVELTNSKYVNVRAYAFLALAEKRYDGLTAILENHLKDTASFNYRSGCMVNPKAINLFYLQTLQSELGETAFNSYMKIVSKQFDPEVWRRMMMTEIYFD
jgi:hypothetical protein